MKANIISLFAKFLRHGVLHREAVKNDLPAVNHLIKLGLVCKIYKQGRVFYELTEKSLPLLENQRKKLLEEIKIKSVFAGPKSVYAAALDDVRFLDEEKSEADEIMFLGDWQLKFPVVLGQLKLAQVRFYENLVEPRQRKAA